MKKLIRKILKEEVHPDYRNLTEGDNYKIEVNLRKLKLMVYILKNYHKSVTGVKSAFKDLGIEDDEILTEFTLIIMFNEGRTLHEAFKTKDLSKIYVGPFYVADIEYYDHIYKDTEIEDADCYICGGEGEIEDDDGDYIECQECAGSGYYEEELVYEKIELYGGKIVAKEPITFSSIGDRFDILEKNPNIVIASSRYIETVSELEEDGGIDKDLEDEIIEISDEDIIVIGESIF